MKPQWQQQQQRRMQQQRQMGYAWQQRQKAKKRAREEAVQPMLTVPPPVKATDRFSQVEAEVARLRRDMAAGRFTEAQFIERLKALMVEDAQGRWWMIGLETDQWCWYDGQDWVPGSPPRLAPPSGLQPADRVHVVSSSAVVYLYGHRFVGEGSPWKYRAEIPCRGVKVDGRGLAETALATAFIALDRSGYGRLHLGTRPGALGILRSKAVCLEPSESGISATGLEGGILASLRDRRTRNNAFSIVRRMRVPGAANPLGSIIISRIREELVEQGHLVEGRGKIAEYFLGKKRVPDCQRIAALEGHVESVRNMVEAFRRADPAIHSQLLRDIRAAMK